VQDRVEELELVIVLWLREQVALAGEMVLNAMLLLKPLIGVMLIVEVLVPPAMLDTELGVAVMEKSGRVPIVTEMVIVGLVLVLVPDIALICA